MKPLKVNVPRFDIQQGLDALTDQELADTVNSSYAHPHVPNKSLRSFFEEVMKNQKLDFTKGGPTNNAYNDSRVEAAYMSFKWTLVQNRQRINVAIQQINRASAVKPPYIIGMQVQDGSVQFGYRPFKHKTLPNALSQAEKLVAQHGNSYTVFGTVQVVLKDGDKRNTNAPVEVTKQGERGKLKPGPYRVMEAWQSRIRSTDLSRTDIPVGFTFAVSGEYYLKYSLSETIERFSTFDDLMTFIDVWLRKANPFPQSYQE